MNGRVENDLKIYKKVERELLDLPSYVNDWYFYLKANDQSAMTCRDYINKIRLFLSFIDIEPDLVELGDINENIITRYFIKIQYKEDGSETSDSYKQCIWSCLNNFFDFLERRGYIRENLIKSAQIKRPKNKDLDRINQNRKLLTQDDFYKILSTVENGAGSNKAKGYQRKYKNRDKLIFLIFMTTGMRGTALSEINIEDIDVDNHTLSIIDKGHKVHNYFLSDLVIDTYNQWLNDRYFIIGNKRGALFTSRENTRMHVDSIAKVVHKYAYDALGYHISPHKLRSGLISIMYNKKHDIEFCRRMIGHSDITTTQRYIVTDNSEREEAANIISSIL